MDINQYLGPASHQTYAYALSSGYAVDEPQSLITIDYNPSQPITLGLLSFSLLPTAAPLELPLPVDIEWRVYCTFGESTEWFRIYSEVSPVAGSRFEAAVSYPGGRDAGFNYALDTVTYPIPMNGMLGITPLTHPRGLLLPIPALGPDPYDWGTDVVVQRVGLFFTPRAPLPSGAEVTVVAGVFTTPAAFPVANIG